MSFGYLDVKWWFIWMQVQTGGVIRECGCAAYTIAYPKKAVIVWTLIKVIIGRNSFSMGGISEEQLLFHLKRRSARRERRSPVCMMAWPQGNFRWEDVLCWWIWINSFPCCHLTLLHSVLPIHTCMSSHNISRITHLFSPNILYLNQRHLFRCVTHWYCHNCGCSLFSGWPGHFVWTGLGPFWGHHV